MLRMRRDFFDDNRIRTIRKYPQGDRFVMIFTMLVGLAERNSVHFSLVDRSGKALTDAELASILGVNRELLDKALLLLDAYELVERIDGILFVNTAGLFDLAEGKRDTFIIDHL